MERNPSQIGSIRRAASVSAPNVMRLSEDPPSPGSLQKKNSRGSMRKRPSTGSQGGKFYSDYADRVVATVPPPKPKGALSAELMSELKAKRQEVKTLQSANHVLTKRLQISEKQLEEMEKTKRDAAFIETNRILMSLQSLEQGTREALKWGLESGLRTLQMGFLMDKPLTTVVVTPPTQELRDSSPDIVAKVEKLKSDLHQERVASRSLQQSVEHEKATLHAQYEVKISELETENFKLTVQKRLDDVELNQSSQRLEDLRKEDERNIEKIDDLHLQIKYLKERLKLAKVSEHPEEEQQQQQQQQQQQPPKEVSPKQQNGRAEPMVPPPPSKCEKKAIRHLQVTSDLRSHTAPTIPPPKGPPHTTSTNGVHSNTHTGANGTSHPPRSSRKVGRSPDKVFRKVSPSPGTEDRSTTFSAAVPPRKKSALVHLLASGTQKAPVALHPHSAASKIRYTADLNRRAQSRSPPPKKTFSAPPPPADV